MGTSYTANEIKSFFDEVNEEMMEIAMEKVEEQMSEMFKDDIKNEVKLERKDEVKNEVKPKVKKRIVLTKLRTGKLNCHPYVKLTREPVKVEGYPGIVIGRSLNIYC